MNKQGALAGIIAGATTVLFWAYMPFTINGLRLSIWLYEIIPGFILSSLAIILVSRLTAQPDNETQRVFENMLSKHR